MVLAALGIIFVVCQILSFLIQTSTFKFFTLILCSYGGHAVATIEKNVGFCGYCRLFLG